MSKLYKNVTVEVNDPSGRLKDGEKINVTLSYSKEKSKFYVDIPEVKPAEAKEDKPKKEPVYEGFFSGVKGTIAANGNMMVSMNMSAKKMVTIGVDVARNELNEAFDGVIKKTGLAKK